jgi:hypothetical protein
LRTDPAPLKDRVSEQAAPVKHFSLAPVRADGALTTPARPPGLGRLGQGWAVT